MLRRRRSVVTTRTLRFSDSCIELLLQRLLIVEQIT